jgi:4-amino-4-deoxyprephenate dehydrogenase
VGQRCVVVGGAGAVGAMFVDLFLSVGAEVCVVDSKQPREGARFEPGDITDLDKRLADRIGTADLVLLAVPEQVALAAVRGIAAAMRQGALLVDTLSVKERIVKKVRADAVGVESVSLNPMFAPSLGIAGRPVAAIVVRDGPRTQELLRVIGSWGGRVIRVSADEHDRLAGATQALTHAAVLAFGFALDDLHVDVAELRAIAPPPHAALLALLARIVSGTPQTYWDVQSANPHSKLAREALAGGLRRLGDLVGSGDPAAFATAVGRLRHWLSQDLEHYQRMCAHTFNAMTHVDDQGEDHDSNEAIRRQAGQLGGIADQ